MGPAGPSGILNSAFNSGSGDGVNAELGFIGPTAQISVGPGQKIFVMANTALGSTAAGGASGLSLFICYQPSGGALSPFGAGSSGHSVGENARALFGLSADISNLIEGDYLVGLCGSSMDSASWNSNDNGYVTAFVHN